MICKYLISPVGDYYYSPPEVSSSLQVIDPVRWVINIVNDRSKDIKTTLIVNDISSTGVIYAYNNCDIKIYGTVQRGANIITEKSCNVFMYGNSFQGKLMQEASCTLQVTNGCDVSGEIIQNSDSKFIVDADLVQMHDISISQDWGSIIRIENNRKLVIYDNSSISQHEQSRFQVNGILEVGAGDHVLNTTIKQFDNCRFEINNASVKIKNHALITQRNNCIFTVKNSSKLTILDKGRLDQNNNCTLAFTNASQFTDLNNLKTSKKIIQKTGSISKIIDDSKEVNIAAQKASEYSLIKQKDDKNSNLGIRQSSRITQQGGCCNFKIGENFRKIQRKSTSSEISISTPNYGHFVSKRVNDTDSELKVTRDSSDRPKTLLTDNLIDTLQTLAEDVARFVLE